jgi:PiT family inorganic phosphate transporter
LGSIWNFAAFFIAAYIIGEFKIGNTIAKTVNENFITLEVIFSGLVAAIAWNLLHGGLEFLPHHHILLSEVS